MSTAPRNVEEILEEALRFGEERAWEEMADLLGEALEDHPDNPYLLCWLGVAEREMGLDTLAYRRFKDCLAQQPEDPHLLATAGNAVAAFDDPDAEPALRTAAMMSPELPLARWMYGAYLSREGFIERALVELRAARELDPDNPVVNLELGVALALGDATEAAVHAFDEAARLDPSDGWPQVLLGLALFREERLEEAVRELSEGARNRPQDVEAQVLAALAAGAGGYTDLAYEMLERARQRAEGLDQSRVLAVEEALDAGEEDALRFLRETVSPTAYRERLMTRP